MQKPGSYICIFASSTLSKLVIPCKFKLTICCLSPSDNHVWLARDICSFFCFENPCGSRELELRI